MIKVDAVKLNSVLTFIEERIQSSRFFNSIIYSEVEEAGRGIEQKLLLELTKAVEILLTPPKVTRGKFIVLSGIDKSGKETQCFNPRMIPNITPIQKYFVSRGFDVLGISLPSYSTLLGSLIAAYLGRKQSAVRIKGEISSDQAWVLWSLDRAQHNPQVLDWMEAKPEKVVLSKRWTESNVVYQKAVGVDENRILKLERNIVKQDYTLVIDLPAEEALMRIRSKKKLDSYEKKGFLEKVRSNYLNLPTYYPFGRIFIINGSQPHDKVNGDILKILEDLGF